MDDGFSISDIAKDLVAYSVVNSPNYKPPETGLFELTDLQHEYVTGLMQRKTPSELTKMLGLSRVQPYLWKKQNKLFAEAVDLIQQMQADELEETLWNNATGESANPIMQMFLLKARKPQYRENATAPTANTVNLHVTIGGNEFKVVAEQDANED